jgi:hypothetical protein
MPISSDEFKQSVSGANEIERLLKENPDKAWSLHEIEEKLIGTGINRIKHLDAFIGNLILLAPLLFDSEKIEYKIIQGIPYFKWR